MNRISRKDKEDTCLDWLHGKIYFWSICKARQKKAPTNCSERETKKFGLNGSLFCSFKNPRQVCFGFCAEVCWRFLFFKVCKINIAYWTQKHQLGKKPNNGTKVLKSFLERTTFFQVKLFWEMHLRKLKGIYLSTEKKNTEKKQKKKTLLPRLRKTTVKKKLGGRGNFWKCFWCLQTLFQLPLLVDRNFCTISKKLKCFSEKK